MPTYGVTAAGFNLKPLAQILSDINTAQLTGISTSLDVQPTALMGINNGIFAGAISELWQLAAALYNGMSPDGASGDQLASLAAISGTLKSPATATVVACSVTVAAGFIAQPGTMTATVVGNTVNLFQNLGLVDNSGGAVPATLSVYFACVDTGPITAPAATLTTITVPLTGWTSITNPLAGVSGANIEADAALRIRRNNELSRASSSTAAAIQSAVFKLMQPPTTSVATTNVVVLSNPTDFVDVNGLPPHSFECIALAAGATAGDNQLLANAIAATRTAGDNTSGTSTLSATDSQGISYPISFTRPAPLRLYASIIVTCVTAQYIAGTASTSTAGLVATALANYVATFVPGQKVFSKKLADTAFSVAGVGDWLTFTVDTIASPVNTGNIVVGVRFLAGLAPADIAVTVTLV